MKRVRKNWRRWTLKTLNVWVIFMMLFQPIGTPGMIAIAEDLSGTPVVEEKAPASEPVEEDAPAPEPVKEEASAPKEAVVEPAPAPEEDVAPIVPEIPAVDLTPAEPVVEPALEPAGEGVPAEVGADPAVLPDDAQGEITPEAASIEISSPEVFAVGEWRENEDGSMTVLVEEGGEYEYKDSGLKISFTRIDSGTGEITVKEIELTDEQVDSLNALSRTAWDITSEMADGTFEYALTFPELENVDEEKVEVVYVEEKADLDDEEKIKTVDDEDVSVDKEKKEITIEADHFTVYVATYSDVALTLSDSQFRRGDIVFVKAGGDLLSTQYYKIAIDPPGNNNTFYISSCQSGTLSDFSAQYSIPLDATISDEWKALLRGFDNLTKCNDNQAPSALANQAFEVIDAVASKGATIDGSCLEDAAGGTLQCTANDVSIANVTNLVVSDDGCTSPSDDVTFTAKWNVQSGANQRYDVGLYFPTEGQNSARTGSCSVTTLDNAPTPPWFDFDGDACGDINQNTLLQPEITLTVACSDPDLDNLLNLPYCTSWDK